MRRSFTLFAVALATLVAAGSAAPASCPPRRYLNEASGTCTPCPPQALTCSSATSALSCERGYFLTADSECARANKCPSGTFPDRAARKCTPCFHADAVTCSDATPTGTTSCGFTVDGAQLHLSGGGCVPAPVCSSGSFLDEDTNRCSSCDALEGRASCSVELARTCGLFFDEHSSQCVSQCRKYSDGVSLPATYHDSSRLVCKSCGPLSVDSCDNLGVTGCRAPFALTWSSECVSREACHDLGPSYFVSYFSVPRYGVEQYETGFCASCGTGVANADRTGCIE
ncbi:hypothetical protein JCM8208_004362 [Rhodotorula glutinis]